MAEAWAYRKNGEAIDGLTLDQLRLLAAARYVRPGDPVTGPGVVGWVAASEIPGLFTPGLATEPARTAADRAPILAPPAPAPATDRTAGAAPSAGRPPAGRAGRPDSRGAVCPAGAPPNGPSSPAPAKRGWEGVQGCLASAGVLVMMMCLVSDAINARFAAYLATASLPGKGGQRPGDAGRALPVVVTYRPSRVGQGVVACLANQADTWLWGVRVTVEGPAGVARATADLPPHGTAEVGWRELDNRTVTPGDRLSLECPGYASKSGLIVPIP